MPKVYLVAVLVLTGVVQAAVGLDVTIKLAPTQPDKIPFVVALAAPGAYCAAAGDAVGLVAVGQKAGKDAQVRLFRLEAQGKNASSVATVKLPMPAELAQRETYPLALAFHPSLPLLYVWQDVEPLPGKP